MISLLKKRPWFLLVSLVLVPSTGALAQKQPGSTTAEPMAADGRISTALRQVSAELAGLP